VQLSTPREAELRGSHVTIDHPAFREMTATLWDQDVIPDFRAPQGIRIGLSPLSTSYAELYRGVAAVRELLAAQESGSASPGESAAAPGGFDKTADVPLN